MQRHRSGEDATDRFEIFCGQAGGSRQEARQGSQSGADGDRKPSGGVREQAEPARTPARIPARDDVAKLAEGSPQLHPVRVDLHEELVNGLGGIPVRFAPRA